MAITLIKEDGTEVAGANTYVTLAEAETLMEGVSELWTGTSAAKNTALVNAATILDRQFVWKGQRTNPDAQPMQWPRDGVQESDRDVLATEIPMALKIAQVILARELIANSGAFTNIGAAATKSLSLGQGALAVEYEESAVKQEKTVVTMEIKSMLEPYGRFRSAGGKTRVRRG